MQIKFPSLWIPALKFRKGQFLNISLLGIGIVVPPVDITFWEAIRLTPEFVIFDTDMFLPTLGEWMMLIPMAVWNLFESILNGWAEDFYERRGDEKEE